MAEHLASEVEMPPRLTFINVAYFAQATLMDSFCDKFLCRTTFTHYRMDASKYPRLLPSANGSNSSAFWVFTTIYAENRKFYRVACV